jgi:hypothetical protein
VYHKSVGRWKNYAEQMEPAMAALEPYLKEFGYGG